MLIRANSDKILSRIFLECISKDRFNYQYDFFLDDGGA